MALSPSPNARVFVDKDTGEIAIAIGDPATGNFQIVGTQWAASLLRDREGNESQITRDGRFHIIEASGLPQFDTDAAAEVDDSYYDFFVANKDCTHCSLYVETNDAIVSFDGGATEHFFVDVDAGQFFLAGLDIRKGSTISGKNAVAAADYDNLRIAIW